MIRYLPLYTRIHVHHAQSLNIYILLETCHAHVRVSKQMYVYLCEMAWAE
jgi:hypothetical protein